MIKPEIIVAIGRKPEVALNCIGVASIYVCHPSHGEANKFKTDIERILII